MHSNKFIVPLTPLEVEWLSIIEASFLESQRTRRRSQAIRLSHLRYSVDEIAQICQATRKTVSGWLDRWQTEGFDALLETPRSGRPLLIPETDHEEVRAFVQENPRQSKRALIKIEERFHQKISEKTLKRIIKKNFAGVACESP